MTSAQAPQNSGTAAPVDATFFTAPEVAKILRIDVWAAVRLCRTGTLRATKPGKKWLVAPDDLQAYIDAGRNGEGVPA